MPLPPYSGVFSKQDFTLQHARDAVVAAVTRLFERDAILLRLDLNEEAITFHFAKYLSPLFPDLHVDAEYGGVRETHPKTVMYLDGRGVKNVYPDVIVHWRTRQTNFLIIEIKRSKNTNRGERLKDHEKVRSFTHPHLEIGSQYAYRFGLFLDIRTGTHITRNNNTLQAEGTWYANGEEFLTEVLLTRSYVSH